jgi:cytochrome c553
MNRVAIVFSVAVSCASLALTAKAQVGGDVAAGKEKAATCTACHGADGNSAAPTFPNLAGQGAKYLLKQMQDIRDGARPVPTMVGQVDNMSDQDLADIAAYYASLPRANGQTDPDLLELGEKVYRSGVAERNVAACIACHSPNGAGNAPAGFPALAGQHPEYIASQLRAYRQGYEDEAGRTNDGDSKIMRANAFGLSDLEIEAVSSYASGLQ